MARPSANFWNNGAAPAFIPGMNTRETAIMDYAEEVATAVKTLGKGVALHNGTSYPSRPTGYASVEWIGPTDPGASAQDGDTWVPTA